MGAELGQGGDGGGWAEGFDGGVSLVAKRHQSMGSRGISRTASGGFRRYRKSLLPFGRCRWEGAAHGVAKGSQVVIEASVRTRRRAKLGSKQARFRWYFVWGRGPGGCAQALASWGV